MTEFYENLIKKGIFEKQVVVSSLELGKSIDLACLSGLFFEHAIEDDGVFYPYEFFTKAIALFAELEINAKTGFLYIYMCFLEKAYENFCRRGIDESIFYDTVKRLAEALEEYKKDMGNVGIYDYRFAAGHVRGKILRLGVFEYGQGLFEGEKAIIMHVPNGADLTKRYDSYKKAIEFFGNYPIILDSWLLYPEHKNMLTKDSKIIELMDDFDIINVHEHYDYNELFHVFGRDGKIKTDTTLQIKYAERIEKKLPIGSAIGKLKSF